VLGGVDDRIALVVNELGEVGVDAALLPEELTRQVELPGGCICCTMSEDLDRTLIEIVEKWPEVVAIVVETTGVAEPLPIAWAMEREPLAGVVRLAAVVTLVDVTGFLGSRGVSPAVDAQVAYADVVILTKTDLQPETGAVKEAVKRLAPKAMIVEGDAVEWLATALRDPDVHVHVHDHDHDHVHVHDHGIDAVWVEVEGVVDAEELGDALAELPASYVRIKGIVRDRDGWVAIHRVGLRVSYERLERAGLTGRLVALGTGVDRGVLAACVERAVVPSGTES
jgi:G3E family GTPase